MSIKRRRTVWQGSKQQEGIGQRTLARTAEDRVAKVPLAPDGKQAERYLGVVVVVANQAGGGNRRPPHGGAGLGKEEVCKVGREEGGPDWTAREGGRGVDSINEYCEA